MVILVNFWPTMRKYWAMNELCVSRGKYKLVVNDRHHIDRERFRMLPETSATTFVAVAAAA